MCTVHRRLPQPSQVLALIGRPDPSRSRLQRRLDRCATVWDLRRLAFHAVPRAVFDYVDGAAMSETSLRRSREAFRRVEFTPHVLKDVSEIDLSVEMLGQRTEQPYAFAPTGFTRMMHHIGEPIVARVAAEHGIAYGLSTLGTTSIEDLASDSPATRRWFQLYVSRDRDRAEALIRRADAAGYDTLILTVDTAVGGVRPREIRNGLTIPPQISLGTLAEMALHPSWWFNALTTKPLEFATLAHTGGTIGDLLTRAFDPGVVPADIAWIRRHWSGKLMLKGVQSVADARIAAELGVDAIVLSNHGGRQLDMANVPLELLPNVTRDVGQDIEVYLDGGIMSGADIAAALAFGARGVLIGRAYLYGLMAGGYDGVSRVVEILEKELRVTMSLLGATNVSELAEAHVRLR